MRYLLETPDSGIFILSDPVLAFKSGEYDPDKGHKIFQIGNEVKIKVGVEVLPNFRSSAQSADIVGESRRHGQ